MQTKQITVFAGALIKNNKILMALRHEPENPNAHLKWEFPGGKCDFGETPEESLKREFMEETGTEIKVLQLLPYIECNYWDYEWGKQQTLCFIFLCEFIAQHKRPQDHHIADVQWFTLDEATKLPSLPGTAQAINLVKQKLKKEV